MVVILGAGVIGGATAAVLASQGHPVRLVSRRSVPVPAGVQHVAADVLDAEALAAACAGATVVVQCLNAPYHQWERFPPMQAAVVDAARAAGARLVSFENLYAYGAPTGPMAEDHPLRPCCEKGRIRAAMIEDLQALHRSGALSVAHVRASDLFGPGMTGAALGGTFIDRAVAGKGPQAVGDLDAPHSWTFTEDTARLLAAVVLDPTADGQVWHVPTDAPRSFREVADGLGRLLDRPVRASVTPAWVLWALGWVRPEAGAMVEMIYEFDRPFVLDDAKTRARFGLEPTPFDEALAQTVAAQQALRGAA